MKVLCVVAHPDDEVLGAGGTLARHAAEGDDVHVCFLSDGVTSRHEERTPEVEAEIERRRERAEAACEELGVDSHSFHRYPDNRFDTVPLLEIVRTVESEMRNRRPKTIYTHHYGDLNVDHELACRAVLTAARPLPDSPVRRISAFETLSSSEWGVPRSDDAFSPTEFVDVSAHLDAKMAAMGEYRDELREPPHPRSVRTIRRNATVWGSKVGHDAVEAFELLREVR